MPSPKINFFISTSASLKDGRRQLEKQGISLNDITTHKTDYEAGSKQAIEEIQERLMVQQAVLAINLQKHQRKLTDE